MAVEDLPPSSCSDPEPEAEWTDCSKRAEQHASAQGCTILSAEARSRAAPCRTATQGGCKPVAPAHLGLVGRRVARISALIRASVTAAARALCAPGVARARVAGITAHSSVAMGGRRQGVAAAERARAAGGTAAQQRHENGAQTRSDTRSDRESSTVCGGSQARAHPLASLAPLPRRSFFCGLSLRSLPLLELRARSHCGATPMPPRNPTSRSAAATTSRAPRRSG
jgi:hypothetical protein